MLAKNTPKQDIYDKFYWGGNAELGRRVGTPSWDAELGRRVGAPSSGRRG